MVTKSDTALPVAKDYTKRILAMRNGGTIYIRGAKPNSIQALCVRIAEREKRKHVTRTQNGGVRVWRIE